jgi:flagellar biosynthetic protein FliR
VRPLISVSPLVPDRLFAVLLIEVLIGLMLGAAVRVALASMQVAGTIVATQLGLSFASMVDPTSGNQNPVIATFLVLLAAVMVFALDLHHLAIRGMADSYRMLPPGAVPSTGDAAQYIAANMSAAFRVGVQVAAPFLVFGIVFNLGLGVLSRLMPQLQIFFLALPATIMIGTLILIAAIGIMVGVFVAHLQAVLGQLIVR